MKAVFVIDIPNELDVNDLLIDYCVHTKGEYKTIRKGGNHPLKPLPKEEESADEVVELGSYNEGYGNGYECGFADGWNACLKEIQK
jgi:hypothetical protein